MENAALSSGNKNTKLQISVVGTSDLHGSLALLPTFAGYLNNLRQEKDAVILVDAGDMFQGTLESNSVEGKSVVKAYNALGYDAAAIGNHEFDFGPAGPTFIAEPGEDPRGALKERAKEANFPFLASNLKTKNGLFSFENVAPSFMKEIKGIKVGFVGATTMSTLTTTLAANVNDLQLIKIEDAINSEAKKLRSNGAQLVVVTMHAGGECRSFEDSKNLESCRLGELGDVLSKIQKGLVDVVVAGHTHRAIAHEVSGIPVIQSYSSGKAFGRVDIELGKDSSLTKSVHPPQNICPDVSACEEYEGKKIVRDKGLERLVREANAQTESISKQDLGVVLEEKFRRNFKEESVLGNLFADLILLARPKADVAITNGGGLRADLPKGPLTYGDWFRAHPFDNQFAFVDLEVSLLKKIIRRNLQTSFGILLISGAEIRSKCDGKKLNVELFKQGKKLFDKQKLTVATSDFLASGTFTRAKIPKESITYERGEFMRDAMAAALSKKGKRQKGADYYDTSKPRHRFPGKRPVRCE